MDFMEKYREERDRLRAEIERRLPRGGLKPRRFTRDGTPMSACRVDHPQLVFEVPVLHNSHCKFGLAVYHTEPE